MLLLGKVWFRFGLRLVGQRVVRGIPNRPRHKVSGKHNVAVLYASWLLLLAKESLLTIKARTDLNKFSFALSSTFSLYLEFRYTFKLRGEDTRESRPNCARQVVVLRSVGQTWRPGIIAPHLITIGGRRGQ